MADVVGADLDRMAELAKAFDDGAGSLEAAHSMIEGCLGTLLWAGGDSEEFRWSWSSARSPALRHAAMALHEAAQSLRANAQAQAEVSAAEIDGASVANSTGGYFPVVAALPSKPPGGGPPVTPADPGSAPGEPGGPAYVIGPPTKPPISWDEHFVYRSENSGWQDFMDWEKWRIMSDGARLLRSDLVDALDFYDHYRSNTGEPMTFDYDKAYRDDPQIRANVDDEIARARAGVEAMIADGHDSRFQMTGDASKTDHYPSTENWQKTVGGYQQWSSADVHVDGDTVTMTITVHAEDRYNFNPKQADIASHAPDEANGRFQEIGWARSFDSSGEITRVITWKLGDPQGPGADSPGPSGPGTSDPGVRR